MTTADEMHRTRDEVVRYFKAGWPDWPDRWPLLLLIEAARAVCDGDRDRAIWLSRAAADELEKQAARDTPAEAGGQR